MRQILLHPGFHKTGTSSAHHFLWVNRDALAPYFDLRMFRHLKEVSALCAQVSKTRDPLEMMDIVELLDQSFATHPVNKDRDLLISCKGFCGHLPCNPTVPTYESVPMLMTVLAGYLADRFPDAQVKVIFTTRDRDSWLFSMYRQQLRGHRLMLDFDEFANTYIKASDLLGIVNETAEALAPLPVMFMSMEDAVTHPKGPGGALVDQMNVPAKVKAKLLPVGTDNEGPDSNLWHAFLAHNRSTEPDRQVHQLKNLLAQNAGLGGWKKI